MISAFLFVDVFAGPNSISLSVLTEPAPEYFNESSEAYLQNKLNAILLKNGVAERGGSRFFITVVATPLEKDIVAGPPQMISYTMDFTFYIADMYDHKVFSTASVKSRGVGTNEDKAMLDALKRVNMNQPNIEKFIKEGKEKIVAYYNENAEMIIKKATAAAKTRNYEEAFYYLGSIPAECDKYDDATSAMLNLYQDFVDYSCEANLNSAKTAWVANQNAEGANVAGQYLSQIMSDAKCYGDAQDLYSEIKGRIREDWDFEMKKYQDKVDLESQRIEAMRAVGVAYGKGQQPVTTNVLPWLRP